MLQAFVHEAVLAMGPDDDIRAPGAAVTVALCGHWDHPPPCPLAPHHSRAERVGEVVHLRTVFVVGPELEAEVRRRIEGALGRESQRGPDNVLAAWELRSSGRGTVSAPEAAQLRDHLEADLPSSGEDAEQGGPSGSARLPEGE